jgi:GNAT superfamily N-acetyltransferase
VLARCLAIEDCALAAWPAADVERLDGWSLRAMAGVSMRANSVWTSRATGSRALDQRIAVAERFYTQRALPRRFQVAAFAQPPALDDALAERGYAIDAPVSVQVALARDVGGRRPDVNVRVERVLSEPWFEISGRRGRFADVQDTYRGLLERIGASGYFALAFCDDAPAAVALGVAGGGWLGISSMFTLPAYRRRGAARSILRALADAALSSSLPQVYLQVADDNAGARELYRTAGFSHAYRYHYRVLA